MLNGKAKKKTVKLWDKVQGGTGMWGKKSDLDGYRRCCEKGITTARKKKKPSAVGLTSGFIGLLTGLRITLAVAIE
jgi:hypothetical protein